MQVCSRSLWNSEQPDIRRDRVEIGVVQLRDAVPVSDAVGHRADRASTFIPGDRLTLLFRDGSVEAEVKQVKPE